MPIRKRNYSCSHDSWHYSSLVMPILACVNTTKLLRPSSRIIAMMPFQITRVERIPCPLACPTKFPHFNRLLLDFLKHGLLGTLKKWVHWKSFIFLTPREYSKVTIRLLYYDLLEESLWQFIALFLLFLRSKMNRKRQKLMLKDNSFEIFEI